MAKAQVDELDYWKSSWFIGFCQIGKCVCFFYTNGERGSLEPMLKHAGHASKQNPFQ